MLSVQAGKMVIVRCPWSEVRIPVENLEKYANVDICKCVRKRWRGPECDLEKRQKERERWLDEVNEYLVEKVLKG